VNVAGQALVPTIVAQREGILDRRLYDAPRGDVPFADDSSEDDGADQDEVIAGAGPDAVGERSASTR
jgi:hypothetical protein